MSLKEITKDLHTEAEKTKLAKALIKGTITKEEYADYLYQMLLVYGPLEFGCKLQGFFDTLPDVERTSKIYKDFIELAGTNYTNTWLPSTIAYHNYVLELLNDPARRHLLKAHLYVRHMGDLHGGQFIARTAPGSGNFYKFKDLDVLKENIRLMLTDELGPEARVAFEWAIKIMKELYGE